MEKIALEISFKYFIVNPAHSSKAESHGLIISYLWNDKQANRLSSGIIIYTEHLTRYYWFMNDIIFSIEMKNVIIISHPIVKSKDHGNNHTYKFGCHNSLRVYYYYISGLMMISWVGIEPWWNMILLCTDCSVSKRQRLCEQRLK